MKAILTVIGFLLMIIGTILSFSALFSPIFFIFYYSDPMYMLLFLVSWVPATLFFIVTKVIGELFMNIL